MAFKQVIPKCKSLLNFSKVSKTALVPTASRMFLIQKSLEMTQATSIHPTELCPPPCSPCPPPPCACPPSSKRPLSSKVLRALWFLVKLQLFVGAVKLTIDEGLWGTGEETEDLAKRMGLISESDGAETSDKNDEGPQQTKKSFPAMWNHKLVQLGKFFKLDP